LKSGCCLEVEGVERDLEAGVEDRVGAVEEAPPLAVRAELERDVLVADRHRENLPDHVGRGFDVEIGDDGKALVIPGLEHDGARRHVAHLTLGERVLPHGIDTDLGQCRDLVLPQVDVAAHVDP
jgi:hypothetical protein